MTNKRDRELGQSPTEQAARSALDQNQQELPEQVTSALAAARKKALDAAASGALVNEATDQTTVTDIYKMIGLESPRARKIWTNAIAASMTALAIGLTLLMQSTDVPVDADYLLTLAELESLDDTEWALVQDLEFALWLSEMGPNELGEALATEPQG